MAEVKEDRAEEPAERSRELQCSSLQTPADVKPQQTTWSQALRRLRSWRDWYIFASVGVVWTLCQMEALLHPSVFVVDMCWRLLMVCVLWVVLGGCVHALKCCLRSQQNQEGPPQRIQQEVVAENRNNQYSWVTQSRSPDPSVPLALVLADSLLLCVLQEPLADPSVPHIHILLSRLVSLSHILEKASTEPVAADVVRDKVQLIRSYLQDRMRLLRALVQVQGDFEASVKDMLEGLDGLWAQLEELHTGVTLTKEENRGHGDLALAQRDAETLFAVLSGYRNKLQSCQTHLKDSTQLIQELTWSHIRISDSVNSSSESVWPELLLQSSIEQFDKVQESFLSLEQQTCTFQAHLEGLGNGNQEGHGGALTHTNRAHSCSVAPVTSPHLHDHTGDESLEHRDSTSAASSAPSVEADTETETDTPLSLCERSALHFSSTIERLSKSGRRK